MDGTILSQGSFIVPSTIVNQIIVVPSGIDWISVRNITEASLAGNGAPSYGIEYFWQRGMPAGSALVQYYTSGTGALNGDALVTGGFTLYDPTGQTPGSMPIISNPVATTATTNAIQPVVSTTSTAGISVGTVIRMSNTVQTDINGIDMVVSSVTTDTSFTLLFGSNALANAPGGIGGAGFYRIVNTAELFYPRHRYITDITNGTIPLVSTSIPHGMTAGQQIRFTIPTLATGLSGMTQMDGMMATVVEVEDDYSFTINVDTSAFSVFVWPTIAQQPSSFPIMVPFGENTAAALSSIFPQTPTIDGIQIPNTQTGILADGTVNTGVLGMILGTGALGNISGTAITGPAGSATGNIMYWRVGKASYGGY
jgi:hypothetical protein